MTDLVRVIYRKYDGGLHWNMTMRRLGEDEHGVWLGLPVGGSMRKGNGPAVLADWAQVLLIPGEGCWTASFNAAPKSTEIYVDITTQPEWRSAAEVTMVDLDLDVIRKRGESAAQLLDEDEFAEHQVRYGYAPAIVQRAEATAAQLMSQVGAGAEPFGAAYGPWLSRVVR